ncbi:MAG: hypothetical protein IPP71_20560 [Bacteroidetes bacterium]|nr:hypothetical protein [Bacteroidota bacterium]
MNSSLNFYGTYWDANVNCVNTVCTVTSQPGHAFGLLTSGFSSMTYYPNLIGIPIHDVGGSVTSIQNTVFHKNGPSVLMAISIFRILIWITRGTEPVVIM